MPASGSNLTFLSQAVSSSTRPFHKPNPTTRTRTTTRVTAIITRETPWLSRLALLISFSLSVCSPVILAPIRDLSAVECQLWGGLKNRRERASERPDQSRAIRNTRGALRTAGAWSSFDPRLAAHTFLYRKTLYIAKIAPHRTAPHRSSPPSPGSSPGRDCLLLLLLLRRLTAGNCSAAVASVSQRLTQRSSLSAPTNPIHRHCSVCCSPLRAPTGPTWMLDTLPTLLYSH
jgi:hypothetical protein